MKVILLKDVPDIGHANEVVECSDAYAMHFLFPQHAAVFATPQALAKLKAHEQKLEKESKRDVSAAGKQAAALEGFELVLEEKPTPTGGLFAAVTGKVIAQGLKKAGYKVDPKSVILEAPIKQFGSYSATVRFDHGFESEIRVRVEPK